MGLFFKSVICHRIHTHNPLASIQLTSVQLIYCLSLRHINILHKQQYGVQIKFTLDLPHFVLITELK